VVTSISGGSPIGGYQKTSMAHCDAGGGAVHSIKSGLADHPRECLLLGDKRT
jgi:hypothetical protein